MVRSLSRHTVVAAAWLSLAALTSTRATAQDARWWNGFPVANAPNARVHSMTTLGGTLYCAGQFTAVAGIPAAGVAAWNGATWSAVGSLGGGVEAVAVYGGQLVAAGSFTGRVAVWNGSAWSSVGSLGVSNATCVREHEGSLVAGASTGQAYLWNGASWTQMGTYGNVSALPRCFAHYGGSLYLGGDVGIRRWDGSAWQPVGGGVNGSTTGMTEHAGRLIVVGQFSTAGGMPANNVAAWDGTSWAALGAGTDARPLGLASFPTELIVTGQFSTAGGSPATRVASWDGVSWTPLGSGLNATGFSVAAYQGHAFVGGSFTVAGTTPSNCIARWTLTPDCNTNGVADSLDIANGTSQDCNGNLIPDECDIAAGTPDCDGDGIPNSCEIAGGAPDCNANGVPDSCDVAAGTPDCDGDGIPNSCEIAGGVPDCNANGVPDSCDVAAGTPDCDGDGIPNSCEIAGGVPDCNANGIPDACDIAAGEPDCDHDGIPNSCEFAGGTPDCDGNGTPDVCDIAGGAGDCDNNSVPDTCDPDCDGDGVPNACDPTPGCEYFAPVHTWSRSNTGSGAVTEVSVAAWPNGDVVLAGSFTGTVDFGGGPLTSAGAEDIFLARFDTQGAHLWSQRFGDAGIDRAWDVAVDPAGDVAIAGSFTGTLNLGGGGMVSAGDEDIFAAKFTPLGAHVWSYRSGTPGPQIAYGVATDSLNAVIITGRFEGTLFPQTPSAITPDPAMFRFAAFTAKFSAAGGLQWARMIDAGEGRSVAVDRSGDIVAGGIGPQVVNFGSGWVGDTGAAGMFYLCKYNPSGAIIWTKPMLGAGFGRLMGSIAIDGADNIFFTCGLQGGIDLGGASVGSQGSLHDLLVVKLSAGGTYRWHRQANCSSHDYGFGVDVAEHGSVVVTGRTDNGIDMGGGFLGTPTVRGSVVCAKYDSLGSHLWSAAYGGFEVSAGTQVATDNSNAAYVTGVFSDSIDLGGGTFHTTGGMRSFLAKFARPVTPSDVTGGTGAWPAGLHSSPNPMTDAVTLAFSLPRQSTVTLAIYNLGGRRVRHLTRGERPAGAHRLSWDGRDDRGAPMAAGVYFARLLTPQGSTTKRIVLLH